MFLNYVEKPGWFFDLEDEIEIFPLRGIGFYVSFDYLDLVEIQQRIPSWKRGRTIEWFKIHLSIY